MLTDGFSIASVRDRYHLTRIIHPYLVLELRIGSTIGSARMTPFLEIVITIENAGFVTSLRYLIIVRLSRSMINCFVIIETLKNMIAKSYCESSMSINTVHPSYYRINTYILRIYYEYVSILIFYIFSNIFNIFL